MNNEQEITELRNVIINFTRILNDNIYALSTETDEIQILNFRSIISFYENQIIILENKLGCLNNSF